MRVSWTLSCLSHTLLTLTTAQREKYLGAHDGHRGQKSFNRVVAHQAVLVRVSDLSLHEQSYLQLIARSTGADEGKGSGGRGRRKVGGRGGREEGGAGEGGYQVSG